MDDDVDCVRFYQAIRQGVGASARRLGVGRNLYPTSPALSRHLGRLFGDLARSSRLSCYESEEDARERGLAAALLGRYLDLPALSPGDVVFTHGAQEGISLTLAFAARRGLAALLPLPLYYSFEQSSRRWGVPIAGHYRFDGRIAWHGGPAQELLQVLVVPNGVTGTLFPLPQTAETAREGRPGLTLIDCVFQLGCLDGSGSLAARTREIVSRCDLERTALLFTASKDLALPGLRAGILVTKNEGLLEFLRKDRFERLYSVNPFIGQTVLLYLALLLLENGATAGLAGGGEGELRARFRDAGQRFPGRRALADIQGHLAASTARCRSALDLLANAGPLALEPEFLPVAGYSVLPRLRNPFAGEAELVAWVREAGRRHGLKLNPHPLFGGTTEIWEELYPGEQRLRVNLSDRPEELAANLEKLAAALAAPPQSP